MLESIPFQQINTLLQNKHLTQEQAWTICIALHKQLKSSLQGFLKVNWPRFGKIIHESARNSTHSPTYIYTNKREDKTEEDKLVLAMQGVAQCLQDIATKGKMQNTSIQRIDGREIFSEQEKELITLLAAQNEKEICRDKQNNLESLYSLTLVMKEKINTYRSRAIKDLNK